MVSLRTAGLRFNSLMKTVDGMPFLGTVEPLGEGRIPSYDFSEPRFLLRVSPNTPLVPGIHIFDGAGRRMMLAENDTVFSANELEFRSFKMITLNLEVVWKRSRAVIDALTKQTRGDGEEDMGRIWVLSERQDREFQDSTLRAKEETRRIMTSLPVQIGDTLDQMRVRRVDRIWGVYLIEVQ